MMSGIHYLIILLGTVGSIHGYRMVFGGIDLCYNKRGTVVAMEMVRHQCQYMDGFYHGSPGYNTWIKCHLDLCDMPSTGAIAKDVWGIDTDQTSTSTGASRTYGAFTMVRRYCDNMNGYYHFRPKLDDWTKCHLYLKKINGDSRSNIHSLIFCGKDECSNKIGYLQFDMKDRECRQMGGEPQGDHGANTWVNCFIDVALSPVIDCEPTDLWTEVQTCWNKNPTVSVMCAYQRTTGIQKGVAREVTKGGSESASISAEVGASLKGVFSASVSTSFTTDYNWKQSTSNSEMWQQSTTYTLSTLVPPGSKVTISQVVGVCNDYYVKTSRFILN